MTNDSASISGIHHISLTVRDVERSAEWYRDVMGLTVEDLFSGDGFRRARLRQPDSGLILTLTQHEHGSGDSFSELRTGLDHLAFAVPSVADVDAFARRFEEYRVEYSERKPTRAGTGAMITLRDPDNIQLEVFTPDS